MNGCELTMLLIAGGTSRVPVEGKRGCFLTEHSNTVGYNEDLLPIPRYSSYSISSKGMVIDSELVLFNATPLSSGGVHIGYEWTQLDIYSGGKAGQSGTVLQSNGISVSSGFAAVFIEPEQNVVVHSGGLLEYGEVLSKTTSNGAGSFYHHSGMVDEHGHQIPTIDIRFGGGGKYLTLGGGQTIEQICGELDSSVIGQTHCYVSSGGVCTHCEVAGISSWGGAIDNWFTISSGSTFAKKHFGLMVKSGGIAKDLTLAAFGICSVDSGGVVIDCHPRYVASTIDPVSSGILHINNGGYVENCRDLYLVHVFSGGVMIGADNIEHLVIHSGGLVHLLRSGGEVVYDYMDYADDGGIIYKGVNAAHFGTLDGVEFFDIMGSGDIEIRKTAHDIQITGTATVLSGGTATEVTCDHLIVSSGGTVSGVHIESGTLTVLSGGTALAVDWNKNRALTLEVDSGAKVTYIYE